MSQTLTKLTRAGAAITLGALLSLIAWVPAMTEVTPAPLPLARTDSPVTFQSQVTLAAPYNFVQNGGLTFLRDSVTTPWSGIRFIDKDDEWLPDGTPHYAGWLMDWANLGGYAAWYDNALDVDLFKIGFRGPQLGRFALGVDPITPTVQFQVHDLGGIDWSLATWSCNNGFKFNSRAADADGFFIQRDDTPEAHWFTYHQGDSSHDWRWGMEPGSYDLVFCNPNGGASSPGLPGPVRLRLKPDGTLSGPTIDQLQSRLASLEKLLPQKAAPPAPQ